ELSQPDGPNFKVNGHRVKHYFGGDLPPKLGHSPQGVGCAEDEKSLPWDDLASKSYSRVEREAMYFAKHCTDNANIIRKRPKSDKHGHGNGKTQADSMEQDLLVHVPAQQENDTSRALIGLKNDIRGIVSITHDWKKRRAGSFGASTDLKAPRKIPSPANKYKTSLHSQENIRRVF
ncbi:hypothetical protein Tco_0466182, partial [Tanacetum coccineum]